MTHPVPRHGAPYAPIPITQPPKPPFHTGGWGPAACVRCQYAARLGALVVHVSVRGCWQ